MVEMARKCVKRIVRKGEQIKCNMSEGGSILSIKQGRTIVIQCPIM